MPRAHPHAAAVAALALSLAGCRRETPPSSPVFASGAPVLAAVEPTLVAAGAPAQLDVAGANFGGAGPADAADAPTLVVRRIRDLTGGAASDPPLSARVAVAEGDGGLETARLGLPGTLAPGVYAVELTNDTGATRTLSDAFAVVPRPSTSALAAVPARAGLTEPLACAANALTLELEGANLLVAGGVGPAVEIVPAVPTPAPGGTRRSLAAQALGCTPVPFSRAELALCSRLAAPLPTDALPGVWAVEVSIPPLAAKAAPLSLVVDGLPDLVAPAGAPSVVTGELQLDVVSGSGGVIVGPAGAPSVELGGTPLPATASECQPLALAGYARCAKLHVTIPQGFASGTHTLAVTTESGCARQTSVFLAPRPVVDPAPPPFCRGSGGLTVTGSGFLDPTVYVNGTTPTALALLSGCPSVTAVCGEVVLRAPTLAAGTHEAFVVNASTPPVSSAPFPLTISQGPPVVQDPSLRLLRTGVAREIDVEVYELTGSVTAVSLVPIDPPGAPIPVDVFDEDTTGVTFTFPVDAPESLYVVEVRDGSPCPGASQPLSGIRTVADPLLVEYDFELDVLDVGTSWDVAGASPVVTHLVGEGHPGSAAGAAGDGTAPWYFALFGWGEGSDVGALRFELFRAGSGSAVGLPGVVLVNDGVRLERALAPPPPGVWTHLDVPLDDPTGWTYRDLSGARPAELADFRRAWPEVRVLGAWTDGPTEAAIDEVVVELAP